MDESYDDFDSDDAALAGQQDLEAERFEVDRQTLIADRLDLEAHSRYIDRVLDLTVGRANPF